MWICSAMVCTSILVAGRLWTSSRVQTRWHLRGWELLFGYNMKANSKASCLLVSFISTNASIWTWQSLIWLKIQRFYHSCRWRQFPEISCERASLRSQYAAHGPLRIWLGHHSWLRIQQQPVLFWIGLDAAAVVLEQRSISLLFGHWLRALLVTSLVLISKRRRTIQCISWTTAVASGGTRASVAVQASAPTVKTRPGHVQPGREESQTTKRHLVAGFSLVTTSAPRRAVFPATDFHQHDWTGDFGLRVRVRKRPTIRR